MAQCHLRSIHHRMIPPMVLGASFGTAAVEKINTLLVIFLSFLILKVSWKFLALIRGERKLGLFK